MVGVLAVNERRSTGRRTRQLNPRLHGLGPAVREKNHLERLRTRSKSIRQVSRLRTRPNVIQIDLAASEELLQACNQSRMVVTKIDGAEARKKIEILPAFVVPDRRALRTNKDAPVTEYLEQLHQ